jgi:hypothetical protein
LIRDDIRQDLREYLHPIYGGPNGDGWPFGTPLRPPELMQRVQRVLEEDIRVVQVGIRLKNPAGRSLAYGQIATHAQNAFEFCEEVTVGVHSLVALRDVTVRFSSSSDPSGGLR